MNNSAQINQRINELNRQRADTIEAERQRQAAETALQREASHLDRDIYALRVAQLKAQFHEAIADIPALVEETRVLTGKLTDAFRRYDLPEAIRIHDEHKAVFERIKTANMSAITHLNAVGNAVWNDLMQNRPQDIPVDPRGEYDPGTMASSIANGEKIALKNHIQWGISAYTAIAQAIGKASDDLDRQRREGMCLALMGSVHGLYMEKFSYVAVPSNYNAEAETARAMAGSVTG